MVRFSGRISAHTPMPNTKLEKTRQLSQGGQVKRIVRNGFTQLMRFVPYRILALSEQDASRKQNHADNSFRKHQYQCDQLVYRGVHTSLNCLCSQSPKLLDFFIQTQLFRDAGCVISVVRTFIRVICHDGSIHQVDIRQRSRPSNSVANLSNERSISSL